MSYSLYLIHLPIMLAVCHLTDTILSLPMGLALSLVLILPLAEVFYRFVEVPSMELGRKLARRVPKVPPAMPPAQV